MVTFFSPYLHLLSSDDNYVTKVNREKILYNSSLHIALYAPSPLSPIVYPGCRLDTRLQLTTTTIPFLMFFLLVLLLCSGFLFFFVDVHSPYVVLHLMK